MIISISATLPASGRFRAMVYSKGDKVDVYTSTRRGATEPRKGRSMWMPGTVRNSDPKHPNCLAVRMDGSGMTVFVHYMDCYAMAPRVRPHVGAWQQPGDFVHPFYHYNNDCGGLGNDYAAHSDAESVDACPSCTPDGPGKTGIPRHCGARGTHGKNADPWSDDE